MQEQLLINPVEVSEVKFSFTKSSLAKVTLFTMLKIELMLVSTTPTLTVANCSATSATKLIELYPRRDCIMTRIAMDLVVS